MTKATSMQTTDRAFFSIDSVSIFAIQQSLKAEPDPYKIYESVAIRLFKPCLSGLIVVVTKARATLPAEAAKSQRRFIASFSVIRNYLI